MIQLPKKTITTLTALAIITFLIVCTWFSVSVLLSITSWLSNADSAVAIASLTASATILASVLAVLFAQRSMKKREIAEAHRHEKTELYTGFINKIVEILKSQKSQDKVEDAEIFDDPAFIDFFYNFHAKLVLWGSQGSIQAYHKFRHQSSEKTHDFKPPSNVLLLVDDLLTEMRKDLGGSTFLLKRGDLIRLFLSDEIPK